MGGVITGSFYLDWAVLAVSLFNTILLIWLGLTVLLNVEQRTWGVMLAGAGLLIAGALFMLHTAIIGRGVDYAGRWLAFWWELGWLPALAAPFVWCVVILWYAGFWEPEESRARRRRLWLLFTGLVAITMIALPLLDPDPLPTRLELSQYRLSNIFAVGGLPMLVLLYPLYSLLCFGLSLEALRRPALSGRVMGDLARRRARPWLAATALVLLAVSLLATGSLIWFVGYGRHQPFYVSDAGVLRILAQLDVVIAGLIGISTLLLGQAVVSYEIFTGRTLPRRGLLRQWRSAIVLAAGFGGVVGWAIASNVHPIYVILLATLLMAVFYALFSWRSYAERERYMKQLRPFVASQGLYEDLVAAASVAPQTVDAQAPFRALCENLLGARLAYLGAVGPLSPLVGPPLVYPENAHPVQLPLSELAARFTEPQAICMPVEPARYAGADWAVPLWSERGLIGVLLLGEKRDGGLYTQEEIEVARASGERLVDTQASVAIAQRLMSLQRQQLAESQVVDRRTRRVLHDDVLPLLHTAMLVLSSKTNGHGDKPDEAMSLLGEAHKMIANLLREMPTGAAPEVARLGLVGALRKAVDDELGGEFDEVTWQVEPAATREVQAVPPLAAEVLFYATREAIRNAAHHGRQADPSRPLHLKVGVASRDGLEITVEDDGVGVPASGRNNGSGGSGQGLALHSTLMAVVGGSMAVESVPGRLTRVVLTLPQTSSL